MFLSVQIAVLLRQSKLAHFFEQLSWFLSKFLTISGTRQFHFPLHFMKNLGFLENQHISIPRLPRSLVRLSGTFLCHYLHTGLC